MSDVFQYIAENNPEGTVELCNSYGFECQTFQDGCNGLHEIASNGGDKGLHDVLSIHPEKDIIIAMFSSKKTSKDCRLDSMIVPTNQASGGTSMTSNIPPTPNSIIFNQGNALLAVGIVALIGIAIIIKKD